jgi:hypothetical protein
MQLFQVNVKKYNNSGKVAGYYQMPELERVVAELHQMKDAGDIFDFEVIV